MDAKTGKSRWFWPTPAWLVDGAALAAGVFFASERWRWFPVNYQKGWPVLLAVAVVGAVLILIPSWMLAALVFRRRVQFGLRTLLVFVTLCAVVCGWFTVRIHEATRQEDAVDALIEKFPQNDSSTELHDINIRYNWPTPFAPEPEILQRVFGDDFFGDIFSIAITNRQLTDADLADIAVLRRISFLQLESAKITDAGLSQLEGLGELQQVNLIDTSVTEEGVKKLQRALPKCEIHAFTIPPIPK